MRASATSRHSTQDLSVGGVKIISYLTQYPPIAPTAGLEAVRLYEPCHVNPREVQSVYVIYIATGQEGFKKLATKFTILILNVRYIS